MFSSAFNTVYIDFQNLRYISIDKMNGIHFGVGGKMTKIIYLGTTTDRSPRFKMIEEVISKVNSEIHIPE